MLVFRKNFGTYQMNYPLCYTLLAEKAVCSCSESCKIRREKHALKYILVKLQAFKFSTIFLQWFTKHEGLNHNIC